MSDHGIPDEALDAALDGVTSAGVPVELARALAMLRDEAAVPPKPTAALAALLEEGPAVDGILTARDTSEEGILTRGILTMRRRAGVVLQLTLAKVAAFSLLGKVAAASAAVTVAASGAGAAGVLPAPAQEAFDRAVDRPAAQVEQDDQDGAADGSEPSGDPQAPATTFGGTVAPDATGADGTPGVDGGTVSDERSDGRSRAGTSGPTTRPTPQDRPSPRATRAPGTTPVAPDAPADAQEDPADEQERPEPAEERPAPEQRPAAEDQPAPAIGSGRGSAGGPNS